MQPSVDNLPGGVITNNVTPDRGGGGTAPWVEHRNKSLQPTFAKFHSSQRTPTRIYAKQIAHPSCPFGPNIMPTYHVQAFVFIVS